MGTFGCAGKTGIWSAEVCVGPWQNPCADPRYLVHHTKKITTQCGTHAVDGFSGRYVGQYLSVVIYNNNTRCANELNDINYAVSVFASNIGDAISPKLSGSAVSFHDDRDVHSLV